MRQFILECLRRSKDPTSEFYRYNWEAHGREKQMIPNMPFRYWMTLAGRGYGKNRSLSEALRTRVENSKKKLRIALIGATVADVRHTMVEGDSGILECSPPWFKPDYEPSKRQLTWPNGSIAITYSGDKPDQLRGFNGHLAIIDEWAKFRYPQECIDQLQFGMRLKADERYNFPPQIFIGTTPKPLPAIKKLIANPRCIVTTGTTFENADNLDPEFLEEIKEIYAGTRIGDQELYAKLLDQVDGALFLRTEIESNRITPKQLPPLKMVVIGVDPFGGAKDGEAGIVAVGVDKLRYTKRDVNNPPQFYVIDDKSINGSPEEWGIQVAEAYNQNLADVVVGESNFGGDMVKSIIHNQDPTINYENVISSRGKVLRALPVVGLYQQNRVHHVGTFGDLESQMTTWTPDEGYSPDRIDALVFAINHLIEETRSAASGVSMS